MRFPLEFFHYLVQGAVLLAAVGALLLMVLFALDALRRNIW